MILTASEGESMSSFDKWADRTMEEFFAEEPYRSFRDRFDVYSVAVESDGRNFDGSTAFASKFGTVLISEAMTARSAVCLQRSMESSPAHGEKDVEPGDPEFLEVCRYNLHVVGRQGYSLHPGCQLQHRSFRGRFFAMRRAVTGSLSLRMNISTKRQSPRTR